MSPHSTGEHGLRRDCKAKRACHAVTISAMAGMVIALETMSDDTGVSTAVVVLFIPKIGFRRPMLNFSDA